jgi:hypothetical protein
MRFQYRWHSAKRWDARGVFKALASVFPRPEKCVILFINSGIKEWKEPITSYRLFNPARLEAELTTGYSLITPGFEPSIYSHDR